MTRTTGTTGTAASARRTYRVQASSVVGGGAEALVAQQHVPFDASAQQGDRLPGPADLLTAAFAACVLKNVERFSHVLSFRYTAADIAVTAQRQDSPPRMTSVRYVLRVQTDESEQRLALLHTNICRHGTIFNTLAAVAEVTGDIVAVPADSHTAP
jgi:uncharacterized OsmC-like protein